MLIMKFERCVCRHAPRTALNPRWRTALLSAGILLGVPSLRAHHGLARFDTTHTVKLQGTVTDFQWINPHAYIYADVKDEHGKGTNWKFELGSLGMLTRFGGWTRDSVRRGDQITVVGFCAKDGSPYMSLVTVQLSNGKILSAAP
jgi:hypothetical protein